MCVSHSWFFSFDHMARICGCRCLKDSYMFCTRKLLLTKGLWRVSASEGLDLPAPQPGASSPSIFTKPPLISNSLCFISPSCFSSSWCLFHPFCLQNYGFAYYQRHTFFCSLSLSCPLKQSTFSFQYDSTYIFWVFEIAWERITEGRALLILSTTEVSVSSSR